ncbi:hypothetical protein [Calothrix sp. PCC 6303]|uniref:hypothetical protein n=1 Tax=Calothrix sp. PCC 6303 TaxID=1170562 RepID=UPI0002A01E29|nr:hypothetical protein [Calothrix sp. PCC 6303]AFZ04167.1 hypothetical protein Cal6303_5281 [Calothrix sp. PCC 6303]
MSSDFEQQRKISVLLPAIHPELLTGLDKLLSLGLISDSQVRKICEGSLTCKLPIQEEVESDPFGELTIPFFSAEVPEVEEIPPVSKKVPVVAGMLQSLVAELSVRWLLFLGMFLVVVSSGVLAATQWERFPVAGQYGILFGYTLSFWGISFWTVKQQNLELTTQALLTVTLLLVPVNFWAMDGFRLWQNPLNWVVIAFAAVILTGVTILISGSLVFAANSEKKNLRLANILGLSFLHWGWSLGSFPLISIYVAMVGTSFLSVSQSVLGSRRQNPRLGINLPISIIIYALVLLLSRGIFVVGVDVSKLGLAIGICGWLIAWLAMKQEKLTEEGVNSDFSPPWELIGGFLLLLGWLVTITTQPAQALAVSGLGLWFGLRRLQLYSLVIDYLGIFVVGLQANWLIWRLVPLPIQGQILQFLNQVTYSQNQNWVFLSLGLFPFLLVMVLLGETLHHQGESKLAKFSEKTNLGFGILLATISIVNPATRSLNLFLSCFTLATVYKGRNFQVSQSFIFFLHTTAVITLLSFINWVFPTLQVEYWGIILLTLMVGEWLYSVGEGFWRQSAWYIGFGLATISFYLLWGYQTQGASLAPSNISSYISTYPIQDNWNLAWLVTPITLTVIASRGEANKRRLNYVSSFISLGVLQFLTFPLDKVRLIGLGTAAALMLVNTNYVDELEFAVITVGFILTFIAACCWEFLNLSISAWHVIGAMMVLGLWLTRQFLVSRESDREENSIYIEALNKWAVALCIGELFLLTIHSVLVYQGIAKAETLYLLAIVITLAAIVFRTWKYPTNRGFYAIGLSLELLVAEALAFSGRSGVKIAIANIILAIATQVVGEFWLRKHRLQRLPKSFHVLPLIYGIFSVILRLDIFTNYTGVLSLGVALIMITVGRRGRELKPILFLGIVGISVSAYETLIYHMLQSSGGAYGDGLIAMSALGAFIMYAYRLLSPWLTSYLRLSTAEVEIIAHCHWILSSFLLVSGIFAPIGINRFVGLGTGLFLARYAIFQARHSEKNIADETWVYLGLMEAGVVSYLLKDIAIGRIFTQQLLPWNAAIACIGAFILYILPWQRFGWSKTPWRNAAYVIPLLILYTTWLEVNSITLILVAGFYLFIAKANQQIRFTYISIALINWALWNSFRDFNLTDGLWYITTVSLSILYIAQIDPSLQQPQMKENRHLLRILGTSLICGYALILHQDSAWIPGIFSLIGIFAGLALRVRAFLYIGTVTFLGTSIYQLIIFSLRYPFLKWVVGLLLGIALISIAANFETRKEQLNSIFRSSNSGIQEWE